MKNRYELRIELLSDLCVSDGGVYNSALDMDVCHDKYGFPYIPAKRLKGCLRESALELKDWGMEIDIDTIFGRKDHGANNYNNRAALRLENAYVESYQELKAFVENNREAKILHPQNVLGNYSYIRTQTSIDYESGVADATSLRTMRVVKKGLVFVADVVLEKEHEEVFGNCCTNLNHIGLSRTRGLGEVKLELAIKEDNIDNIESMQMVKDISNDVNCFEYALTLKEPVICKSVNGGESNTLDYIEGSKILGMLAGKLRECNIDFIEFMNKGELFCSNAYIENSGIRGTEVSACVYSVKNEGDKYVDKTIHAEPAEKQLNSMKHCYVSYNKDGHLVKKSVNTEERYHHSRPDDKSIGRSNDKFGNSKMYQMASICEGQTFRGYITGTNEQIKEVARLFNAGDILYIGYSTSSEYGKTVLSECKCTKIEQNILKSCKEILVKLDSPTIIYNKNATYSTNPQDLIDEINEWLCIENVETVNKYIKYTTIGGYNVTWRKRKPTIEAFDKGTALHYVFAETRDINIPDKFYIGERVTEGYGECNVIKVEAQGNGVIGKIVSESEISTKGKIDYSNANYLAKNICDKLYNEYISKKLNEINMSVSEEALSTISNMLIMCKENDSFDTITQVVKKRYDKKSQTKKNKAEKADQIIKKINEVINDELIKEFENNYSICNYSVENMDYCKKCALEEFLIGLKYKVRTKKMNKGGDVNE